MNAWLLCGLSIIHLIVSRVAAYDAPSRWGQATVIINNALFIHGGKTDPFNSFGYQSAPNSNDLLYLPLSSPFNGSSPPWQLLNSPSNSSSSQGPTLSWHTLSAFNTSHILLFGGQPGPNSPTVLVDAADSASLLNVFNRLEPEWIFETMSWANEPVRRIHHSTATSISGSIYIIGGQKADGSNNAFSEHYIFQPNIPSFTVLSGENGPPDISGHASVILADGRLLVFGGYSQSQDLTLPFSTIWVLDTTQPSPSWSLLAVSTSSLPTPRRAFAVALLSNGIVLIHGGSDAVLQNNFADGWILNTTQNPMAWTQVDALSQLGARRDHFAVPYDDQVIFGFGYGDNGASPSSLQIYDVGKGSFTPTFTPMPSSTPTQTLPGPSQTSRPPNSSGSSTGTHGGVHPSSTLGPNSGGGNGGGGGDGGPDGGQGSNGGKKTTALAVGTALGVLGLLFVALAAGYYVRRKRRQADSDRRFMALQGDDDDGETSPHLERSIPAATYSEEKHPFGGPLGVLGALGLAGIVGTVTGSRNVRNVRERRDMLADEDTRDFGEWYDERRRDGTGGSSWSLKSILGSRVRSREPSIASTAGGREKGDPFTDGAMLMRDEETGYAAGGSGRPHGRRQMSYTSAKSYVDPFADPIQEETEHHLNEENKNHAPERPYLHPLPQPLPTLRTILPISQGGHTLSPLSERTSQNTLSIHDVPNSVSSHSTSHNSPFDSGSSRLTSHTSLEQPRSPGPFTSSIISSNGSPNQSMRRSDSWWTRFSRTSFLDRRLSDASRHSGGMPDIRDPNPPPRLVAIEESVHSASPDRNSPKSPPSTSSRRGSSTARRPSEVYGGHNKSMSSVRTADTAAIERMAGTMDVVQRSGSQRTARTASTGSTSLKIDTRPSSWIQPSGDDANAGAYNGSELMTFASPIEMSPAEYIALQPRPPHALPSSTPAANNVSPASSGAVAARIQELEHRQSQDAAASTNTKQPEERTKKSHGKSVNYGLIQRPSLYVANPDHRTTPSNSS